MNNLAFREPQAPFSFLALNPPKSYHSNGCERAWCYDNFHLEGNNYYLYVCHSSNKHLQIKKGTKSKEIINWGGQNV